MRTLAFVVALAITGYVALVAWSFMVLGNPEPYLDEPWGEL